MRGSYVISDKEIRNFASTLCSSQIEANKPFVLGEPNGEAVPIDQYATFNTNGAVDGWHYYVSDYMGNNRMVVNKNGTVEQVTHYYPYGGVIGDISTNESLQRYKFEGKELDRTFGLDNYDIHARQYFSMAPSWDRIDPLTEDTPQFSPYSYCMGDPVNLGDYNGESTRVVKIDSTHYQVVGGDINDGDNNFYVCIDTGKEGEDRYENTWFSIGITPTMTSFYNSDSNQWKGKIDVNDNSGYNYIKKLESDEPSLLSYCIKAQTGELYDFKETNGEEGKSREDHYRGMPFGTTTDGTTVYSSARDIGNITIGYICGAKGVPWSVVRIMFDRYQGESEGISSQNAQRLGWSIGIKNFLHR